MTPLFGQDEQMRTMLAASAGGRMHHGWILAGPKGIGKASFARAAALRLLVDAAAPSLAPDQQAPIGEDHPIARLIAAGAHPDYVELERLEKENGDLARNISVDQVRSLQRLFSNRPSLSERRIVLIDSADDLERSAANALLKNLEEPPAGTVFLLVAHAPARLLPTIRSRCRVLRFSPLTDSAMREALKANLPDASEAEIQALMIVGGGAPGRALELAGLRVDEIETALQTILTSGDPDNRHRLLLARALAGKTARPRYEAFLDRAPTFIAAAARNRSGTALGATVEAWEQARNLVAGAVVLALDPASVVFDLCSLIAALSPQKGTA
jgi:DNA polymerase-3 subunit delta'